jgi:hypothetical protein
VIVGALLIVGLFVPMSFGGDRIFNGLAYLSSTLLLSFLILRPRRTPSPVMAVGMLSVIPLLVVFTFTAGFNKTTWGELGQFAALALLYMSYLRSVEFPRWLSRVYLIVNITNIVMGIAILAGSDVVKEILVNLYSQGYTELVPAMLFARKPVLTFGTHSVAGFFLYLFFYVNWATYKVKKSKLSMVFALCYLCLTLALLSVTGLLLSVIGIIQVLYSAWSSAKHRWVWASSMLVVGLLVLSFEWDVVSKIAEAAKAILTSPGNGFLGRLTPTGTMYWDMQYVMKHPFSPVGLSVNTELLVADMGLLDYFIRGSIILVVWVYGGLFFFLRRNLIAKADLYFLFAAIMAFELGFSVLLYPRTPFLLAFFVIYLNGLRRSEGLQAVPLSSRERRSAMTGQRGTSGEPHGAIPGMAT